MHSQSSRGNGFAIVISVAVVVLLVLIGLLVVWLNSPGNGSSTGANDEPADVTTGVITVGDGATEVDVWFDYACPHCQNFEVVYGEAIGDLVDNGDITLRLNPVALPSLNAASGTEFSARAGGALLCVAEESATAGLQFHESLFALRPSGPGLSDDELTALAEDAGAPGAADCITASEYAATVSGRTEQLPRDANGGAGTPTLVIDDEYVVLTGSVQADILDRVG